MTERLAIVLGGGGARGALQVGALRAILEAGYRPDILAGTSIGAGNAAVLGLRGANEQGLAALVDVYRDAAQQKILERDYLRLLLRALVRRPVTEISRRIREFYIAHGLTPELKFGDLKMDRVLIVATDLNCQGPVIYGLNPADSVLEAVLASTALPPWVTPIERDGRLLMDGGVVSNLPLEPALAAKPREIIALDIQELRDIAEEDNGFGALVNKLVGTVQKRQVDLELALAASNHVKVRYIHLYADQPTPVYAFERWEELIERGYQQANQAISRWPRRKRFWWSRG
jgi:NTE family protein